MMQKATILILAAFLTLAPSRNEAADPAVKPVAPKSAVPQIYEKEESGRSFTDVVKVLRQNEDALEVLFEKQQGVHHVPRNEAMIRDLRASQKSKIPVAVKVDDNDRVLSVDLKKPPAAEKSGDDYDEDELKKLMKSIKN